VLVYKRFECPSYLVADVWLFLTSLRVTLCLHISPYAVRPSQAGTVFCIAFRMFAVSGIKKFKFGR